MRVVRSAGVEVLGWVLLLLGIAALFLPGPGLLAMFGGLALLSSRYAWAQRWVEPVRLRALRGAADGVATWPRMVLSCTGAVLLAGCGVLWILSPAAPTWWNLPQWSWLPGGLWVGVTQIGSAVFALGLLVYSFRRFHGKPEAVVALGREIKDADHELSDAREEHREHREERRERWEERRELREERRRGPAHEEDGVPDD
jgi:hypothetical protein